MLSAIYHPSAGPTLWALHPPLDIIVGTSLFVKQRCLLIGQRSDLCAILSLSLSGSGLLIRVLFPLSPDTTSVSSPAGSQHTRGILAAGPRALSQSPLVVSKARGLCSAVRLPGLGLTFCALTLVSCMTLGPSVPKILQV